MQRQRGDYEYPNLDLFLRDVQPSFGERTVGVSPYYGNQHLFYAFVQDDWKLKRRFTLNLGLNYVYQQVPHSARLQTLNSIASVPGVLTFDEPKAQKTNFAPRVGIAYAPDFETGLLHRIFGSSEQSSINATNFAIGEGSKKIQFRADFYNAFNHPQYVPGSIDGVEPITTTGVSQVNRWANQISTLRHMCSAAIRG